MNFNTPTGKAYKRAMADLFPLFRMFLADEVDAIIVHFNADGLLSNNDLHKVDEGLKAVIVKIATMYPDMVPGNSSILSPPALDRVHKYRCEHDTRFVVFHLMKAVIHLQAETATFITAK